MWYILESSRQIIFFMQHWPFTIASFALVWDLSTMLIHSFVHSNSYVVFSTRMLKCLSLKDDSTKQHYSDTLSSSVPSIAILRIPFLNSGVPLSLAKTRAFSTIFNGVPDGQHITSTSSFNIFSLYANSSTFNLMKEPNSWINLRRNNNVYSILYMYTWQFYTLSHPFPVQNRQCDTLHCGFLRSLPELPFFLRDEYMCSTALKILCDIWNKCTEYILSVPFNRHAYVCIINFYE